MPPRRRKWGATATAITSALFILDVWVLDAQPADTPQRTSWRLEGSAPSGEGSTRLAAGAARADDITQGEATATAVSPTSFPPSDSSVPRAWPCLLGLPTQLFSKVRELWASSPTFRRQCNGIAQAQLTVAIGYSPFLAARLRATSRILFRDGRPFYALVTLRDDLHVEDDLPHELEHVIEQIEGRDLAIDAARRRAAWVSTPGVFETERAIAAGVLACKEVREARRSQTRREIGRPPLNRHASP